MDSSAKTSGFNTSGGWSWPEEVRNRSAASPTDAGNSASSSAPDPPDQAPNDASPPNEKSEPKHYKPRTCRICLETVQPTYQPPSTHLPSYLQGSPNVTYVSEEGGRLLRPCKCKGSQRHVHEGCLQEWRHADPSYGARNFWQCPTCGFKYRLERVKWGRWISSKVAQLMLTVAIFLSAVFLLGFIADPIISAYTDPVGSIMDGIFGEDDYSPRFDTRFNDRRWEHELGEKSGWVEHFLKGFASLGVLGFLKMLWGLSPLNWLNLRGGGIFSGGRVRMGNTGRARAANVSWLVLLIGVCTFLFVSAGRRGALSIGCKLTDGRLFGKVFVHCHGAFSRKLANALWTCLLHLVRRKMTMSDYQLYGCKE